MIHPSLFPNLNKHIYLKLIFDTLELASSEILGYTGYTNAKLGQTQIHERITAISGEFLMQIKEMAEKMASRSCTT
jgi:hypothetical protein